MLAKAATKALQIAPIQAVDKPAWATLFRAYVDFYGASIPETQYQSTFDRLIDPAKDLHCLVLRTPDGSGEERKLFGIAHFYPHQTPWSEKPIMHLNGLTHVEDLFIDPELRGQGHGRRMIQQVAELAKQQDCLRVEWATKFDNPARKFTTSWLSAALWSTVSKYDSQDRDECLDVLVCKQDSLASIASI